MKNSTLILGIIALFFISCNTPKSSDKNKLSDSVNVSTVKGNVETDSGLQSLEQSVEIKQELKNLLKKSESIVKKEVSENEYQGDDLKPTRVESDSDIVYYKNGFNGSVRKKPIVSDFNTDGKTDVMIEIEYNTGEVVDRRYLLFLNSASGIKYTNEIGFIHSECKSNPKLYSEYGFVINQVKGDMLIGNSYYAKPEDLRCCPSFKCIEHYKFNNKTNDFDLVYQSKLITNKYEN